jgi:hypothetical protein
VSTPTIIVYTHIINSTNHPNGAIYANQNTTHLQTSMKPSPKLKMENNNTKPCAKNLA